MFYKDPNEGSSEAKWFKGMGLYDRFPNAWRVYMHGSFIEENNNVFLTLLFGNLLMDNMWNMLTLF